jgi:putative ABC transport system ATP-binding protein
MSDRELIQMEGVEKVFLTEEVETHALSGVHIKVSQGEFITIEGPSGCGKTTLLSLMGLLDTPTAGSYHLDGQAVESLSNYERAVLRNQSVGFIFQSFNLIGDLTVYENVELPLVYRNEKASTRRELVQEALEQVDMGPRQNHYPAQLSGGQQQRVDSRNGVMVMDLLKALHRRGSTVCMVTHDPRYHAYAGRTIHLFDGQVVDESIPINSIVAQ